MPILGLLISLSHHLVPILWVPLHLRVVGIPVNTYASTLLKNPASKNAGRNGLPSSPAGEFNDLMNVWGF